LGAAVSINFVQSILTAAGSVGSATTPYTNPVISGDFLCIGVQTQNTAGTMGVQDNVNGVWQTAIVTVGSVWQAGIYYVPNSFSGNISVTVTQSGTPAPLYFIQEEFNGIVASNPLDQTSSHSATSTTPDSGSTSAISQVPELVIGLVAANDGAISAGAGFTLDRGTSSIAVEYLVAGSPGPQIATFSTVSTANYLAMVATFRGLTQSGPLPRQVYVMP
jgi:hypothetical protein